MAPFLILTLMGCEKFIDPGQSKSQILARTVFSNDATATAAISGLYATLNGTSFGRFINYKITAVGGLLADEFIAPNTAGQEFYLNNVDPASTEVANLWSDGYATIYQTNAILEGLKISRQLTPSLKKQLHGEAVFIRALSHFYLLNLFGEIPYITTTSYLINDQIKRIAVNQVYTLMLQDLQEAVGLLSDTESVERSRPDRSVAKALLARVYLYNKDWENAEITAAQIIQKTNVYHLEEDLKQVFLRESSETIWQLKPSAPGYNTFDGNNFILTAVPTVIYLSDKFVNGFEKDDKRKNAWVDSLVLENSKWHYAAKYKVKSGNNPTEYTVLFRLSEQYLIRAEALVHLNRLTEAITAIDKLRLRAGLPLLKEINPGINSTELLLLIEKERRAEFFAEMGHRWFDLKRTDRANTVLGTLESPDWKTEDQLLPIPKVQLDRDRNMVQNPGYSL